MIVELGGGFSPSYCKRYNSGINIDALDHELVDIKHDLNSFPYPLEDNSVDEIYSKFFLEHVSWRVLPTFAKEMYRIIKPNGRATFIVPNFREQVKMMCRTKEWDYNDKICMVFGDQNYDGRNWVFNAHASSSSPELYEKLFKSVGFRYFFWDKLPNWNADMEIVIIK